MGMLFCIAWNNDTHSLDTISMMYFLLLLVVSSWKMSTRKILTMAAMT
jgi:hypothetical protein